MCRDASHPVGRAIWWREAGGGVAAAWRGALVPGGRAAPQREAEPALHRASAEGGACRQTHKTLLAEDGQVGGCYWLPASETVRGTVASLQQQLCTMMLTVPPPS